MVPAVGGLFEAEISKVGKVKLADSVVIGGARKKQLIFAIPLQGDVGGLARCPCHDAHGNEGDEYHNIGEALFTAWSTCLIPSY